jgi:N6-L-threonylcarbamoyladenine synthase
MIFLGIETSCDETSAAVLNGRRRILSSVVLSQDKVHAPFGGVVPELASRQHIRSIGYVVDESLRRAKVTLEKIDLYAVTQGPGLIGSLLVGLSFAKALSYYFDKPLIPVDHLEAHIESAFLEHKNIEYPCLALLVSGGHTSLFMLEERLHYRLMGRTRDDAAGEALDKIAKFLDLGYPGGPIIDRLAEKGKNRKFVFALPQMTDKSLDFSFSGLKTSALRKIKKERINKNHPLFFDFLASFEQAVIRALLSNTARAAKRFKPRSLILCGGVARNKKLRRDFMSLAQKLHLSSYIPSSELCTDNAAMVAALAEAKYRRSKDIPSVFSLNAYPRA